MLEVARLDILVRQLLNSALVPSTIHAYTSAQTWYAEFCSVTQLLLLPLTESGLCRFSAWLAAQTVSVRTIKSYLSALRYLQIQCMGHDPQISSMATLHITCCRGPSNRKHWQEPTAPEQGTPSPWTSCGYSNGRGRSGGSISPWSCYGRWRALVSLGFRDWGRRRCRRHQHTIRAPTYR